MSGEALHLVLHKWTCIQSGQNRCCHFQYAWAIGCLQTLELFNSINLAEVQVPLSSQVKLLGVVLYNKLTLNSHVKAMNKSIYFYIQAFCHIQRALKEDTAKTVAMCMLVPGLIIPMQLFMAA